MDTEKLHLDWQLQGEEKQASSLTETKNMQLAGAFLAQVSRTGLGIFPWAFEQPGGRRRWVVVFFRLNKS